MRGSRLTTAADPSLLYEESAAAMAGGTAPVAATGGAVLASSEARLAGGGAEGRVGYVPTAGLALPSSLTGGSVLAVTLLDTLAGMNVSSSPRDRASGPSALPAAEGGSAPELALLVPLLYDLLAASTSLS